MPGRKMLTEHQRAGLLDLPIDEASMLHHYTLGDDDLEIIRARRRHHNRFGFAFQFCALRYPGRLLTPVEVIPLKVTRFLAAQLGLKADDLADSQLDPPSTRRLRDHRHRSGRKALVQLAISGDPDVRMQATWRMSDRTTRWGQSTTPHVLL